MFREKTHQTRGVQCATRKNWWFFVSIGAPLKPPKKGREPLKSGGLSSKPPRKGREPLKTGGWCPFKSIQQPTKPLYAAFSKKNNNKKARGHPQQKRKRKMWCFPLVSQIKTTQQEEHGPSAPRSLPHPLAPPLLGPSGGDADGGSAEPAGGPEAAEQGAGGW